MSIYDITLPNRETICFRNYGLRKYGNENYEEGEEYETNRLFGRVEEGIHSYRLGETTRNVYLNRNYLVYFPFRYYLELRVIDLSNTQIIDVPILPPRLEVLAISQSQVQYLPELPETLKILKASHGRLRELPVVPRGMLKISVRSNQLRDLPFSSIRECQDLVELRYDGNPFEVVFPEDFLEWVDRQFHQYNQQNHVFIRRFRLERKGGVENRLNQMDLLFHEIYPTERTIMGSVKPTIPTLTSSGQNVHSRHIIENIGRVVDVLENVKMLKWKCSDIYDFGLTHEEMIHNLWLILLNELKEKNKLIRGGTDDYDAWKRNWMEKNETTLMENYHFVNVSWMMGKVFGWYVSNHSMNEWRDFIEILANEWEEWRTVCLTGRLMRCMNLLTGVHPDFQVSIPLTEQIQQKYNFLFKKYSSLFPSDISNVKYYYQETIRIWQDFGFRFREALQEIEVESSVIDEWVSPLFDNALETEKEFKERHPDLYEEYLKDMVQAKRAAELSYQDFLQKNDTLESQESHRL